MILVDSLLAMRLRIAGSCKPLVGAVANTLIARTTRGLHRGGASRTKRDGSRTDLDEGQGRGPGVR